jgi:Membrane-associated phospholipid phosphatase
MLESLKELFVYWDYEMWYRLHATWRNDVLDALMPYARNQWTWAPLYLFLLIFITGNFKRNGWIWCLFFLLTFALTDFISASIIKPYFERIRPCNNRYISHLVKSLVPCGSGYSFPSSHAANHFGMAVFSAITLQKHVKKVWPIALGWAFLVIYAQVYVGVHYPMDVLCGGLLGTIIGLATGKLFNRKFRLELAKPSSTLEN